MFNFLVKVPAHLSLGCAFIIHLILHVGSFFIFSILLVHEDERDLFEILNFTFVQISLHEVVNVKKGLFGLEIKFPELVAVIQEVNVSVHVQFDVLH